MAKKAEYNFSKERRDKKIKSCVQCNGAPPTNECTLQGLKTTFCELCMEVVDWSKVGEPIKIKQKVIIDSNNSVKEVITLDVQSEPGTNFEKFEIV